MFMGNIKLNLSNEDFEKKNTTFFLPVPELVGDLHALISFYVQTIKTKTMIRFSPEGSAE